MLLEQRTVSRKTPGDGRLEITKRAATLLRDLGRALTLDVGGERSPATVASMPCTCRGVENPHEHFFLEDAALRGLIPGDVVDIDLDIDAGIVRVINQRD